MVEIEIGWDVVIVEVSTKLNLGVERMIVNERLITGQWVFDEDNDTEQLYRAEQKRHCLLFQKKIPPRTIIYNDRCKAYERIDKNVYRYRAMDRSKNFADPDTGVRGRNIDKSRIMIFLRI